MSRIEKVIAEVLADEWIPKIYAQRVRTGRTRAYELGVPQKENEAFIQHTLLGIELKVGKRRLTCPDLSTARYLRVFARIGCREIAIPYDISRLPSLADTLESAWQRTILVLQKNTGELPPKNAGRMRSAVIREIRRELAEIGAGEKMPEFGKINKNRPA